MKKYHKEQDRGTLYIRWNYVGFANILLIVFGCLWVVSMGFTLIATGSPILILMLLMGLFVVYTGIVMTVNKNVLSANSNKISVTSKPLPSMFNRSVETRTIKQLFIMEEGQEKIGDKVTMLYSLKAVKTDDKTITLVRSIRDKNLALELEATIESHLGIVDQAIPVPEIPFLKKLKEKYPAFENVKLPGPINDGKEEIRQQTNDVSTIARVIEGFRGQDIYASDQGDLIDLDNSHFTIANKSQFDWSDGRSDLRFVLQGDSTNRSVYAEQDSRGRYYYFEERLLTKEESISIGFETIDDLPAIVQNGDDKYYHRNEVSGYVYANVMAESLSQLIYFRTTGTDRFRVVKIDGELKVYIQEPIDEALIRVANAQEQPIKLNRK